MTEHEPVIVLASIRLGDRPHHYLDVDQTKDQITNG